MSLSEIRNVVLLFSNPVWSGANTVPTTIIRNITALSSQVAYEARLAENITTLTTTNADTLDGTIQGLLYVPDINFIAACNEQQYDFIPRNVTRQDNLPPTNYNLIALAPWFSIDCTQAYLASARLDPIRAFIFYKPNNSTNKPQDSDSPVWNLDDDGAWKSDNQFPIFAIPGLEGQRMMTQLSLYSGNTTQIPHGEEINELYGPNPNDYVRIWTELTMTNPANALALWVFFLIIIGGLLLIIASVSLTMHFIQRRRRTSLRRRVESGEVDLEAMGIKRLTVPATHVKDFPLFTYNAEPDIMSVPPTPTSAASPRSVRSSSRRSRRLDQRSVVSVVSTGSIRSKRSSLAGGDTTATNFQPNCHICLVKFEHRLTVIRELPCGHIFHPECIDEYLTRNSSLCPMCKHCMLPRGFSPKITNGMVRRERAVRRLRERVYLDDSSLESGQFKFKLWGKRFFTSSTTSAPPSPPETLMTPVRPPKPPQSSSRSSAALVEEPEEDSITSAGPAGSTDGQSPGGAGTEKQDSADGAQPPPAAKKPRPRKTRPRALRLLPTQPEDGELKTTSAGRKSPSSFARERMRALAAKNAPFDDPDSQHPKWRRALSKVFPGFT